MNNILSAISGQFSKSLLLSTLLPVVVFVLLAWALVVPLIPHSVAWLGWIDRLDAQWKLAVLTLANLLLAAVLYNLNGQVIRFYEGYPWQDSWIGAWQKRRHGENFDRLDDRWRALRVVLGKEGADSEPGYEDAIGYWSLLGRLLNKEYPTDREAVLPTRLGNVIRSYEDYPSRQYSMEAITLWPRLVSVIDERYAAQIDEAKSSLDFMLNSSFLCGLLAAVFCGVRLFYPTGLFEPASALLAALVLGTLLAAACLLYRQSIARASAWGELVKGAFDLYRWDLLEALGWEKPKSLEAEADLWDKISTRLIYSDLAPTPPPDYQADPQSTAAVAAQPAGVALEVTRAGRLPWLGRRVTIEIVVRNPDATTPAVDVSVHDRLPEGWLCVWDSAGTDRGPVEILGTNPYRFRLGDVGPGQRVILRYRAVRYLAPIGAEGSVSR